MTVFYRQPREEWVRVGGWRGLAWPGPGFKRIQHHDSKENRKSALREASAALGAGWSLCVVFAVGGLSGDEVLVAF